MAGYMRMANMKVAKQVILILVALVGIYWATSVFISSIFTQHQPSIPEKTSQSNHTEQPFIARIQTTLAPTPTPTPIPVPDSYEIPQQHHTFQTFNNCGPASLSMTLSYFEINVSQQELGLALRPYQVASGDNDDKSVTLAELANYAKNYDLIAYHRPLGSIKLLQQFISQDIPVIVRTYTTPTEDIGHFRVIRGYDEDTQQIIQDDSLQGAGLRYSYTEFLSMWQPFNYEYLVLVRTDQTELVEQILGENLDERTAWQNARAALLAELATYPDDVNIIFNLSIAEYHLGNYQQSINYYESVAGQLPSRTLWYQIEPIRAYQALGENEKVFAITNSILNNGNRAFSELYLIQGEIYESQGNLNTARERYGLAVRYNSELEAASEALNRVVEK